MLYRLSIILKSQIRSDGLSLRALTNYWTSTRSRKNPAPTSHRRVEAIKDTFSCNLFDWYHFEDNPFFAVTGHFDGNTPIRLSSCSEPGWSPFR
jgi:hypothetical protein